MAIALFNDQDVLAGQKLGISTAKAIALMVMACGLGAMNIYHMGYIYIKVPKEPQNRLTQDCS